MNRYGIADSLRGLSTVVPDAGIYLPDENVFTSFEDAPLDYYDIEDGDDSILASTNGGGIPLSGYHMEELKLQRFRAMNRTAKMIVPYTRKLRKGAKGLDVLAVDRALAKAGFGRWGYFSPNFGAGMERNIKKFQASRGLKPTGIYDLETHAKLKSKFDLYGASLMTKMMKKLQPSPTQKLVSAAIFGYNNRHSIHYTQSILRMYGVKHHIYPPNIPIWEDCSSFATWTYYVAGLRDPNGFGYNGFGYTGTLAQHGIRTGQLEEGNLVFYGGGFPYSHVAICVGFGRVVSHGSEIGPLLLDAHYRPISSIRDYII